MSRTPRAMVIMERRSLTKETLDLMQKFVNAGRYDSKLCHMARRIVAGAKTPQQQAERIHNWVRTWIQYKPDPPEAEMVQDAEATLRIKTGDCDDLATIAGAMLRCLGHDIEPLAVWWKIPNRSRFTHAVVMDHSAGLVVDPVAPTLTPWPPMGRAVYATMGTR